MHLLFDWSVNQRELKVILQHQLVLERQGFFMVRMDFVS
jgi:hypothetical protein